MRYRSLIASAVVLLGVAACKGDNAGMNADLANDLAAAKTSDAFALAPHAGEQSVVSATELSPQARARLQSLTKSSRPAPHRTPHRDRAASVESQASVETAAAASDPLPAEVATVDAPAPVPAPADPTATAASTSSARPQPVDVPPSARNPDNGGGIGAVIGAIGGVILRGGVADGDHCDPRGRRSGGGGILINQRGPILRGHF